MEPLINNDPVLSKMFPKGADSVQVCHRRGGWNIKEILAPSSINMQREERNKRVGRSEKCNKNCRSCSHLAETSSQRFTSTLTKRHYTIRQVIDCKAEFIVYLVTCKKCNLQGVGSTKDSDSRLANYLSNIRKRRGTCCIVKHFLDSEGHTIRDFTYQPIVKLENLEANNSKIMKRLRSFEGYWQIELGTIQPFGMNSMDEFYKSELYPDTAAYQIE